MSNVHATSHPLHLCDLSIGVRREKHIGLNTTHALCIQSSSNSHPLFLSVSITMKVPRRKLYSLIAQRAFSTTASRRELRDIKELPDRNLPSYHGGSRA